MTFIVLILVALNPVTQPVVDVCDRLELSHVFTSEGRLCFDQIIVWEWDTREDRYQVVDWRLLRDVRRLDGAAEKRWDADHPLGPPYVPEWIGGHATPREENGRWVSEWYDEKTRKHRRVVASTVIETACDYDREVLERQVRPESERRGLR